MLCVVKKSKFYIPKFLTWKKSNSVLFNKIKSVSEYIYEHGVNAFPPNIKNGKNNLIANKNYTLKDELYNVLLKMKNSTVSSNTSSTVKSNTNSTVKSNTNSTLSSNTNNTKTVSIKNECSTNPDLQVYLDEYSPLP